VQQGSTNFYAESIRGAYQGFFDNNIQPDFVHIDDIKEYPIAYLPYPVMLKSESAKKLADYVQGGGILISEGLPAYFGDHGKAGTVQPNYGLDQLFGAREDYVEFTPDILDDLTLKVLGHEINGRYFLQAYTPAGGMAAGNYADGRLAAVEHQFGRGKTLLMGSFAGGGYYLRHSPSGKAFFAGLMDWAKAKPALHTNAPGTQARLHNGAGGTYLYVVNPVRTARQVEITLEAPYGPFESGWDVWGERNVSVRGRTVSVEVGGRDAAVVRLK
jgi:beta-galactosidase